MPLKDPRWRGKHQSVQEQIQSASQIQVNFYPSKTNEFKEMYRTVFPTGMENWVNVIMAYRLVPRRGQKTGKPSHMKCTIRKYQQVPGKGWKRRQSYNCNSKREAQQVILFLRKTFPDLGV